MIGGPGESISDVDAIRDMDFAGVTRDVSQLKKSILVHTCCGPCSTAVIERLAPDYDITIFFYNPNITDEDEYLLRFGALRRFVLAYSKVNPEIKLDLIAGKWDPDEYFSVVKGLEGEPEGGMRCASCFDLRLSKTAEYAAQHGFQAFTTTLSISPHKNFGDITRAGAAAAKMFGVEFLAFDFKKRDGYKRSVELSKTYGVYRQDYCGCKFSRPQAGERG